MPPAKSKCVANKCSHIFRMVRLEQGTGQLPFMFVSVIHSKTKSLISAYEKNQESITSECSLEDAMLFKGRDNRKGKSAHSFVSLTISPWLGARETSVLSQVYR